jgi:hypothetical protein
MRIWCAALAGLLTILEPGQLRAKSTPIEERLHHLRAGQEREWSDFPANAEGSSLTRVFQSDRNDREWSLRLRQQDVKQIWRVLVNGKEIGRLLTDENDTVVYLPIPAGLLRAGENKLVIEPAGPTLSDDIRVGEIFLEDRPVAESLSEARVEVSVREADLKGRVHPVPCRLTVLNAQGALMTLGARSGEGLAVRPGVIYTRDGKAAFGLPAGTYTIYAGRGFEYGIDSATVTVRPGDRFHKSLTIRREVPTEGWVSCDTHVHTLTHSGHGDATLDERVLTIAGEGLQLPIATEHNKQVDYQEAAGRQRVREYFTPVIGNEVTTPVGHFNIFPVTAGGPAPDFNARDWKTLFASIRQATAAKVIVLNHARDRHLDFRPFGPERHLALAGEDLDGWDLQANAMEVVNSGAQQTDGMQLFHDWLGLLNAGRRLAPIGASDSHDVGRYIVGQGRTYIRCRANNPGAIEVDTACKNLAAGHVLVSCGLLVDITVNEKYGPGDLAPVRGDTNVTVRVWGPSWVTADKVELFLNGRVVRDARVTEGGRAGLKCQVAWQLPKLEHDAHLAAVASGPGVMALYWPIAKPYQPTSPRVERRVFGATGAVWLDADSDGKWTSPRDYAEQLAREHGSDWRKLLHALKSYDEAVAIQAAALLRRQGISIYDPALRALAKETGPHAERGLQAYAEAWRECQLAREKKSPGQSK